jgi:histidinol-phosphate aminotransferase
MKFTIDESIEKIPYYPKAMMYGSDEGWVRLSSNENPFPPSPSVMSALLDAVLSVNRYPGAEYELKTAIAARWGLKPQEVLIGNGSNELIEMTFKGMKHPGRNSVIIADPSFAFYAIAAAIYGYEAVKVPLSGMHVDLKAVAASVDEKTRLIFLNNPLNPTGTIFEHSAFADFLKGISPDVLVVVDEAYEEFVESEKFPRSLQFIHDYPVLVLKTFSKAYGLAGLRVGYGIGDESLIPYMERTKQPFSVNSAALTAAKAALADESYLKMVLSNNRVVKKAFCEALESLSIEYVPTETNFVLLKIGPGAEGLTKRLFDEKIVLRWMAAYSLPEYIRVTLGRIEENMLVIEALRRLADEKRPDHHH